MRNNYNPPENFVVYHYKDETIWSTICMGRKTLHKCLNQEIKYKGIIHIESVGKSFTQEAMKSIQEKKEALNQETPKVLTRNEVKETLEKLLK